MLSILGLVDGTLGSSLYSWILIITSMISGPVLCGFFWRIAQKDHLRWARVAWRVIAVGALLYGWLPILSGMVMFFGLLVIWELIKTIVKVTVFVTFRLPMAIGRNLADRVR